MGKQETEPSVVQEAGEVVIAKIKSDLRLWAAEIPYARWIRHFPDTRMPLLSDITSPLLEKGPYGHDEIHIDINPNGKIMEWLIHYQSDGYDSEIDESDELLGEANSERYQSLYDAAIRQLEWLKRESA